MSAPWWPVVVITVLTIFAVAAVLWDRHHRAEPKGIGVRIIQFLAVVLILPSIVILSITDKITGEATATLLGTIVGYVLSGIGKDEPPTSSKKVEPSSDVRKQTHP